MCAGNPESQPDPGLHEKKHGQQVEVILPLCSAHMRPHMDYCFQLYDPQHMKDMDLLDSDDDKEPRRPSSSGLGINCQDSDKLHLCERSWIKSSTLYWQGYEHSREVTILFVLNPKNQILISVSLWWIENGSTNAKNYLNKRTAETRTSADLQEQIQLCPQYSKDSPRIKCTLKVANPIRNFKTRVNFGTNINIFVSNMDSGIESTLSNSANDTMLCGVVDTLEGRDVIPRDLDRLERWACANIMKFNKIKCKVLNLIQSNSKPKHRLRQELTESSPKENFGVLVDEKLNLS
ncbi:hypothetical protein BTVI_08724 [Pitangus sulphuratus]|nr:hypothetical protein BTVI_08724 [Pitangus sulphuratus]